MSKVRSTRIFLKLALANCRKSTSVQCHLLKTMISILNFLGYNSSRSSSSHDNERSLLVRKKVTSKYDRHDDSVSAKAK
jgi:hypothetical protein